MLLGWMQEQIKGLIINLMLHTPPSVRAQVSEALTIISTHDFPARWQGLLPELIAKLDSREKVSHRPDKQGLQQVPD